MRSEANSVKVVQSLSCVRFSVTLWTEARQAPVSPTISQSLFTFVSIKSVMLANHLILHYPLIFAFSLSQHQGLFPVSQFFTSGGRNMGASVSASVLPMNVQGWFPLGLTDLISLQSKELSRVFSSTTVRKHQFFGAQPSLWSNSHICTCLLEEP